MNGLTRFLGDTPLRVFVRLLVLSFIVGLVLASLNVSPFEIYDWVRRAILRIYDMGFSAFVDAFGYLVAGALIVVPLFLIARLLRFGGRRRAE
jgi:hypothetical protein